MQQIQFLPLHKLKIKYILSLFKIQTYKMKLSGNSLLELVGSSSGSGAFAFLFLLSLHTGCLCFVLHSGSAPWSCLSTSACICFWWLGSE